MKTAVLLVLLLVLWNFLSATAATYVTCPTTLLGQRFYGASISGAFTVFGQLNCYYQNNSLGDLGAVLFPPFSFCGSFSQLYPQFWSTTGTCTTNNQPGACTIQSAAVLGDNNNCGRCGYVCPPSGTCCALSGTIGWSCADITSDTSNCGACGNVCDSAQLCVSGTCTDAITTTTTPTTTTTVAPL